MNNDYEPRHLQKATKALEKHLKKVEKYAYINEEYKKGILKEPSLWEKFIRIFKV